MPNPTISDVHVDRPLTNIAVAYTQDDADFVASKVFPAIPVNNKSDSYFIYNRGDFFRNVMQKRAPGTPAAGGGYKLTTATYTATVWAVKKIIDDQTRSNSDAPLQPDRDATAWLTQQALLNREVSWATAYFGTGIWGNEVAGIASGPNASQVVHWSASSSTPIANVLAAQKVIKKATGKWPNTLVLGADTYFSLLTNAEIIDRLKYGAVTGGPVTVDTADLAKIFKVNRVLVMSGIQTTSVEDNVANSDTTPDTFDFVGGKHALLCYSAPAPSILEASAGYTFNWTGLTGSNVNGMRIKKFRWEIDAADHLEIEQAYAFGLVGQYLGYFFKDVVT